MKPFVLLIQLAIGSYHVESFDTYEACDKALRGQVARFQKGYVVRSAGCFPREMFDLAAKKGR